MNKILWGLFFVFNATAIAGNDLCNVNKMLSLDEIQQKLVHQGYKNVKDMKLDDCLYEARVKDKHGDRWEVQVNPQTGIVIGKERDSFYD